MTFIKTIFGKAVPVDPLNDQIRARIDKLILSHLDDYEKNYNRELFNVYKEWKSAGKKFTFSQLDQETHNRAGIKSLKDTISNKTWTEIGDDVDKEVKTKTTNDMIVKASNAAGKKTVSAIVSKSVDEGLKKITKKAEAKKK